MVGSIQGVCSITRVQDDSKARLAAGYLKGNAGTWWRSMVLQAGGDSRVIDWRTFERQLISTFKPVNSKSIARHKLAYLKQTHSVFFSQILILGTIQAEMVTQWI